MTLQKQFKAHDMNVTLAIIIQTWTHNYCNYVYRFQSDTCICIMKAEDNEHLSMWRFISNQGPFEVNMSILQRTKCSQDW